MKPSKKGVKDYRLRSTFMYTIQGAAWHCGRFSFENFV